MTNDLGVASQARCYRHLLPRRALSSIASRGRDDMVIFEAGHW